MTDVFDQATRSRVMRTVKSENTSPEKIVRSILHALGYRFRIHRRDLPGSPDIVLPGRKTAIFVHGCFWHGHNCPRGQREPKDNAEYWRRKRAKNMERDVRTSLELLQIGWRPLIVWECEIRRREELETKLVAFLGPSSHNYARKGGERPGNLPVLSGGNMG